MKLLFDQNLSPRLVALLEDVYPGSAHVHGFGMDTAADSTIWTFTAQGGWTIVSKDSDFQQRSLLFGAPPRVIWIRMGNSSVQTTAELLRNRYIEIRRFHEDRTATFLAL